ncbi:MAG TPA: 1-deoxy-D-xylulose-5-phosphate reductoisomerase [Cryomorphaceae bacterium]|nr:1-deoxy-D-xylulose-5-phosphate reductoisomerase [Cryomorphaceae bacterium]
MSEKPVKNIALLGSTGSIGTQTLEIVEESPDRFRIEVLTARRNARLLCEQAKKFKPNAVVIVEESDYEWLNDELFPLGIKVYCGERALVEVVQMETVDIVLTALVGFAGLRPTLSAIEAGKNIALANKETLVVAGELVTEAAKRKGVNIYPVDSEHSAIFQCLMGEFHNPIDKIVLTASGGPFRGWNRNRLESVGPEQALKHPNWVMGRKITIDSASLMNKGLEVIEAKWLFALQPRQIEVVVHPQSIIHSMVQFEDGSMKAQMGLPDMKLPIRFALSYPHRFPCDNPRLDFTDYPALTFEQPDTDTFPNLRLAYEALETGGNAPCVLNSANEVAVEAFLNRRISFLGMSELIESCMSEIDFIKRPTLSDYLETDRETARLAERKIGEMKSIA